jgi:type III secretory pathway component EscV
MKPSSDDDYNNINKNQIGSSNVTLKSKIIALQEAIELVNEDFKANINDIKVLEKEKDEHQKVLKQKTEDMKKSLLVELAEVEKEMKKHLVVQKEENNRLQKLITQLKGEKTVLMSKLVALQRRISDMENQVGTGDLKLI